MVENERDIPKKVKVEPKFYGDEYYCPVCDRNIFANVIQTGNNYFPKYCSECGQAIKK